MKSLNKTEEDPITVDTTGEYHTSESMISQVIIHKVASVLTLVWYTHHHLSVT